MDDATLLMFLVISDNAQNLPKFRARQDGDRRGDPGAAIQSVSISLNILTAMWT